MNDERLALKATDVRLAYGRGETRAEVLKRFSLSVGEGEFVALMGPSGSGKSTFLHLAAGLLVPDSGRIEVGGEDVTAMGDTAATKFRRRHEGVVFQAFNLLETLTVRENIVLPARLDHGRPDAARVAELVAKLGLSGKEGRRPSELSGGEQQRVAIARALYAKPAVVLADEPTGNLDAKASRATCEMLRELNQTERSAILLVTHDPVVAAAATRVCYLRDGRIVDDFETGHDAAEVARRSLAACA